MSSNNTTVAVSCHGLTKQYGSGTAQVMALRGIDLEVYQGELLMLVGPSGCGKTTLISIITSLLDQDDGSCEVLGQDLRFLNTDERGNFRRESVGFVFQMFNLLPALTVLENVAVPLLIGGMGYAPAQERARTVINSIGLADRAYALPSQLSGGQQQRVAIARALVHEPRLIVCDEPTSNLDHKSGHEMMMILRDVVKAPDRTLIVVTHDNRILPFADRIAHMDDGRIVEISGSTNEAEL